MKPGGEGAGTAGILPLPRRCTIRAIGERLAGAIKEIAGGMGFVDDMGRLLARLWAKGSTETDHKAAISSFTRTRITRQKDIPGQPG